ncbi:PAS domain-containing protein [Thermodesulfobacteriota bacterium]
MHPIFAISYLRNILLVSLAAALLLPAGMVHFVYPSFTEKLVHITENEALRVANHLTTALVGDRGVLPGEYSDTAKLRKIQEVVKDFHLMKLKIFSRSGKIVYSTDQKDIGTINQKKYFHEKVANGERYTKVVKKDAKSLEDQVVTVDVVETYIPIMRKGGFVGAFEIYYDITDRKEELDALLFASSIILVMLSVTLLSAVVIVLKQAGKNITEREQAEANYRKQNDFLNDIIASLAHPFYIINAKDYTIALANPAARQMGVTEGTTCHRATHRQDRPCTSKEHPCPLIEVVNNKESITVEHVHYDKEGNARTVEVHGHPLFDEEGNVVQMIEYTADIEDRKLAEAEREKIIAELKNALAEVKALSGLLPICAACKKIRDDKGYWNQIESYIRDHSEADFSHSICPECAKKIYPDIYEEIYKPKK